MHICIAQILQLYGFYSTHIHELPWGNRHHLALCPKMYSWQKHCCWKTLFFDPSSSCLTDPAASTWLALIKFCAFHIDAHHWLAIWLCAFHMLMLTSHQCTSLTGNLIMRFSHVDAYKHAIVAASQISFPAILLDFHNVAKFPSQPTHQIIQILRNAKFFFLKISNF